MTFKSRAQIQAEKDVAEVEVKKTGTSLGDVVQNQNKTAEMAHKCTRCGHKFFKSDATKVFAPFSTAGCPKCGMPY